MTQTTGRYLNDFDFFRLTGTPLFKGIPGLDKPTMFSLGAQLKTYQRGQLICDAGEEFPYVAFLVSGEVEGGFSGSTYYQMIDRFHPGETFGEAIAMKGTASPVEIRATKQSEVLLLDCNVLLNSPDNPAICMLLSRVTVEITNKMMVLINKVRTLRNPVIVGRVAEMLLNCTSDENDCVTLDLTQSELGAFIGSSRSRVSGALSILVNDGLIEQVDRAHAGYRILDRRGLEYTAFNGRVPLAGDGEGAGVDSGAASGEAPGADAGDANGAVSGEGSACAGAEAHRADGQAAGAANACNVDGEGDAAGAAEVDGSASVAVSIDSTRTMRAIVGDEPPFERFLQYKGFPFSVDNPITEIVTFDDVATMQHLDKEAFIAEYAAWKAQQR